MTTASTQCRPRKVHRVPRDVRNALDRLSDQALAHKSVQATEPGTLARLSAIHSFINRVAPAIATWFMDWVHGLRLANGLAISAS